MKIFLIRHGRQCSKLCNVDVDLSEEGYRQASLLGERLFHENIQVVYSSNLLRAVETAQAANLYWNVEHIIRPLLWRTLPAMGRTCPSCWKKGESTKSSS